MFLNKIEQNHISNVQTLLFSRFLVVMVLESYWIVQIVLYGVLVIIDNITIIRRETVENDVPSWYELIISMLECILGA